MTTAAAKPGSVTHAGHERPCFCETCLGATLYDLLDERAALLQAALSDHRYTPGLERELAEEVIAGIPVARRAAALEITLTQDHLQPRVLGGDCLLDECDKRSYTAVSQMARILLDAISAQDNAPAALRIVVTNEICERHRLLQVLGASAS